MRASLNMATEGLLNRGQKEALNMATIGMLRTTVLVPKPPIEFPEEPEISSGGGSKGITVWETIKKQQKIGDQELEELILREDEEILMIIKAFLRCLK